MLRSLPILLALALVGSFLVTPAEGVAQVRVSVAWNDLLAGGPYVYAELGTRGAYVVGSFGHPSHRYRTPRPRKPVHVRRGVRIPPGHLPGPGQCRVWYPNRPPGHQPPPFRCSDRYHGPAGPGWGYDRGPAYGPGHRGEPRVYPRPEYGPEYGPRVGYRGEPRYDIPRYEDDRYGGDRYDDDRYDDDYLDDILDRDRDAYDDRLDAEERLREAGLERAEWRREAAERWAELELEALERRRELQREGRGRGGGE